MSDTPHYDAALGALTAVEDEAFWEGLEAIEDPDEKLRAYQTVAKGMLEAERMAVKIRRRAEWHAARGLGRIRRGQSLEGGRW